MAMPDCLRHITRSLGSGLALDQMRKGGGGPRRLEECVEGSQWEEHGEGKGTYG